MFGFNNKLRIKNLSVELPEMVELPEYSPEEAGVYAKANRDAKQRAFLKAHIENVNDQIKNAVDLGHPLVVYGGSWNIDSNCSSIPCVNEQTVKTLVEHFVKLGWDASVFTDECTQIYPHLPKYFRYYIRIKLFDEDGEFK